VKVETEADLAKLRHWAGPRLHDDERLLHRVVTLHRGYRPVGTIEAATDSLAWDAYRICAGIRFRREDGAVWPATEAEALPLAA
jgi:hypothetical protein